MPMDEYRLMSLVKAYRAEIEAHKRDLEAIQSSPKGRFQLKAEFWFLEREIYRAQRLLDEVLLELDRRK